MNRRFKHIVSLLLLLIFIFPSIVKLEHKHDHVESKVINEKNSNVFKDKCPICNFEFSIFLSTVENIDLPKDNPLDNYRNNYNSRYNSNLSQFSFLLRAPPARQI
jgi:hypothetical protein